MGGHVNRRTVFVAAGVVVAVAATGALAARLLRPDPVAVAATTLPHGQPVAAVAFSPDGRTLAAAEEYGGGNPVVKLWDYRAGTSSAEFAVGGIGTAIAFSLDGARLVTGGYDAYVEVHEVATGKVTRLSPRAEKATAVAFGPTTVASGGTDGVRLRDASTGADGPALDGGGQPVSALAFSPDGALLAAGGRDGVRLWDARTGAVVTTLGGQGAVASVAFSADGALLAAGGDDAKVRVWNALTFRLVHTLSGHRRAVVSVAFGPEGKSLASVDGSSGDPKDDNDVTIRLWRVYTGTAIGELPVAGTDEHGVGCSPGTTVDTTVAIGRDGRTLAANCGLGVRLWRLTGQE